jgi:SAM-dependent methyltransferase
MDTSADHARRCIVCDRSAPFPALYARDGYTIVRCARCGLAFQDPQPSDEALAETYYHDEEWTRAIQGPLREKVRERAAGQLTMLDDAGVRPPGRLLDVGCSIGAFIELAGQAGWTATGVEIGEATAASARENGLDVRTGTLADVASQLEPHSFSLITFWDVIEHLRDPRDELEIARGLLRPGGLLAAAMPNVGGWYPRATHRLLARTTGAWEYPELPVHLYDFSPEPLRHLLANAGFVDARVRTYPTPFWYYRDTSLSVGALGGRYRGRILRGAFELLHAGIYPAARLADRQNAQFVTARVAA